MPEAVASAAVALDGPVRPVPARAPAIREAMLHGPILSTLLKLGLPTIVVLIVQTMVGVTETYFVSYLGTEALAGVALVFPVLMLMQMMANGGIGGGVSSAIARALGSGRRADAQALVWHGLVLSIGLGILFAIAALAGGPWIYRTMGGSGAALEAALTYSNVVFIAAIPLWMTALLASALRGSGQVKVPALVTFTGAVLLVPLSPALIFGFGPLPRLGIAGAGTAVAIYYVISTIVFLVYLRRNETLRLRPVKIEGRLIADIMGVGALSALGTIQSNLTVTLVTGLVGVYGTEAIAGYGIASRLDYLLIPLLFGFGTAVITMVGTALGAGDAARARRIAWTAAALGAVAVGAIGFAAALFPNVWTGIFTTEPVVMETSARYLRIVAPFYALFGGGMMLYFASQGANKVLWPVVGGTVRLLIAGIGGWLATAYFGVGLDGLFTIVAASLIAYGLVCIAAVRFTRWGARPR